MRIVTLVAVLISLSAFGGQAMQVTIDQTSVSLYAGICVSNWRALIVAGEHGHWGGIIGFRSVGPWSDARRYCLGARPF